MADHKFHSKVQIQPGTTSNHAVTKSQMDTAAANASNLANATGQLPDTTFIAGFDTSVDSRISTVLELATTPETLNTLNELAAALGDDPNYAATVTGQITDLDGRIDALEAGSGTAGYKVSIGDATLSSFSVTHNLNSTDVVVTVIELANGQTVFPVVTRTDLNTATIDFGSFVPALNSHRVLVTAV